MKYSEIIEKAKGHLHKETYVCLAIKEACNMYGARYEPVYWDAAKKITGWIEDLVGCGKTYHEYLEKINPELCIEAYKKDPRLYKERLAWMDELIAYWKERGN